MASCTIQKMAQNEPLFLVISLLCFLTIILLSVRDIFPILLALTYPRREWRRNDSLATQMYGLSSSKWNHPKWDREQNVRLNGLVGRICIHQWSVAVKAKVCSTTNQKRGGHNPSAVRRSWTLTPSQRWLTEKWRRNPTWRLIMSGRWRSVTRAARLKGPPRLWRPNRRAERRPGTTPSRLLTDLSLAVGRTNGQTVISFLWSCPFVKTNRKWVCVCVCARVIHLEN